MATKSTKPLPVGANSLLHDRNKVESVRRSTPDSQAIGSGSSDEEHDHSPLARVTSSSSSQPKTRRRTSWLSEINPMPQRKASFTAGSLSGNSQPPTPSADGNIWSAAVGTSSGSSLNRVQSNTSAGRTDQAWGVQARKDGPSRLKEVLPISAMPNGRANGYDDHLMGSPVSHTSSFQGPVFDDAYPVHMPLQPTIKNYRSQSYSVGQMEPTNGESNHPAASSNINRAKVGLSSNLRNRTSRPRLLSEKSHDKLGRLREVDDDDESANGSDQGAQLATDQSRAPLGGEGTNYSDAQRNSLRTRRATTSFFPPGIDGIDELASAMSAYGLGNAQSDFAVDEAGEPELDQSARANNLLARRMSELATSAAPSYRLADVTSNTEVENTRRGHWSSSLGFGSIDEGSQSRRHSLTDVPARRHSVYSEGRHGLRSGLSRHGRETENSGLNRECIHIHNGASQEEQALQTQYSHARTFAASYFSGQLLAPDADVSTTYGDPNPYGIPQSLGTPRAAHSLHVVTFKCFRADVFYIQEGTGLKVEANDLVIVEADRGTDLGTVQHPNVSWAEARELKERYAKEHYKCLMMFSRHSMAGQAGTGSGMFALSNGNRASVAGGMGPQGAVQPGGQDPVSTELRPKMIRRQAQPHEVTGLQDKEGNEAKAKRVCQQKVIEHRLNMEILDAEFQMDWKKLTFYYFADEYINFNTLVTDLFKIYKTRIWMSAINPASFATPSAGLPTSIDNVPGSGMAMYGRGGPGSQRLAATENQYPSYGPVLPTHGAFNQMYEPATPNSFNRAAPHGSFMPFSPQTFDPASQGMNETFPYVPTFSRPSSQVLNPYAGYGGSVYPSASPVGQPFARGMAANGYNAGPLASTNGYDTSSQGLMNGYGGGNQAGLSGYASQQGGLGGPVPGFTSRQNGHGAANENKHANPGSTHSRQRSGHDN